MFSSFKYCSCKKCQEFDSLTITQIDIFLIFTPANPDHIYHFTEDLGGRKLWYNPDPLLLWGNGILRTLALASGSTPFLWLNADHHIQQGIDFLLHQSLSKLILCNGFYYTIWWYYKLISLYRTPLINTLSTALPGPILAETLSAISQWSYRWVNTGWWGINTDQLPGTNQSLSLAKSTF